VEGLETLQQTYDKVTCLVQREVLSQTLPTTIVKANRIEGEGGTHNTWAAVEGRVHKRCRRDLFEQGRLGPSLWTEIFGIWAPQVWSFMREKGGHHDLCFGWEVELACAWDNEWTVT
jgi:hypothetical protein